MGEVAYVDGELMPLSEAKVSIFDRGFMYGDGLFETMRVYEKVPFLLDRHIERIKSSARALEIPFPSAEEMRSLVGRVISANDVEEGALKIIVTRGTGERSLSFPKKMKSNVIITLTTGLPYGEEAYKKGFKAVFVPEMRTYGNLKSLCFLANVLAKSCADRQEAQEAFFVRDGYLTEGAMSNVFAVQKERVITPPLNENILPGITRDQVLDLAAKMGLDVYEERMRQEDLQEAKEVFITNSVLEVMAIVRIEDREIGDGRPGETSFALRKQYKKLVNELSQEMLNNG